MATICLNFSKLFDKQQSQSIKQLQRLNALEYTQFETRMQLLTLENCVKLSSIETKQLNFYEHLNKLEMNVKGIRTRLTQAEIKKLRNQDSSQKSIHRERKSCSFVVDREKVQDSKFELSARCSESLPKIKVKNPKTKHQKFSSSLISDDVEDMSHIKYLRSYRGDIDTLVYLQLAYQKMLEAKSHLKLLKRQPFSCHDRERKWANLKLFDYEHM
jgi:hypothetical protein